jgi:hypothetical protein
MLIGITIGIDVLQKFDFVDGLVEKIFVVFDDFQTHPRCIVVSSADWVAVLVDRKIDAL